MNKLCLQVWKLKFYQAMIDALQQPVRLIQSTPLERNHITSASDSLTYRLVNRQLWTAKNGRANVTESSYFPLAG